jgi:hypothetical protein
LKLNYKDKFLVPKFYLLSQVAEHQRAVVVCFHINISTVHMTYVFWTKGIQEDYYTVAQLYFMMRKSKSLKDAMNSVRPNVKSTKPTTATESAFLSTDHAMEIV